MSDRALTFTHGRMHFAWRITSDQIELYLMTKDGVRPERRIGLLVTTDEDGQVVPFEQEPFEAHCEHFLHEVGRAELSPGMEKAARALHRESDLRDTTFDKLDRKHRKGFFKLANTVVKALRNGIKS